MSEACFSCSPLPPLSACRARAARSRGWWHLNFSRLSVVSAAPATGANLLRLFYLWEEAEIITSFHRFTSNPPMRLFIGLEWGRRIKKPSPVGWSAQLTADRLEYSTQRTDLCCRTTACLFKEKNISTIVLCLLIRGCVRVDVLWDKLSIRYRLSLFISDVSSFTL